jgi:hypothetical protein
MAKKPSTAMPLDAKSTAKERSDANRQHHQELIGHTLDNAVAVGHGHAVGSGPTGKMVPNDSAFQGSAETSRGKPYIPQGALNVTTRDGGAPFDDNQKVAGDYGTVDKTGDY